MKPKNIKGINNKSLLKIKYLSISKYDYKSLNR